MSDIPDAKRVRRNELSTRSQSSSPTRSLSPDLELEAQLQARLAALYDPIALPPSDPLPGSGSKPPFKSNCAATPKDSEVEEEEDEEDDEASGIEADDDGGAQEFEFRLFAAPARNSALSPAPQIVVLKPEEEDNLDGGGFIVPRRDPAYYFMRKAEGEVKRRFNSVALSGDEVLELSARRAWGLEIPWRVRTLRVVGREALAMGDKKGGAMEVEIGRVGKRTKPGKKRRIILRGRKKKAEQMRREMELKEESERDKKTRMNREKKAKRKLREKAKKAGLSQVGSVVEEDVEGGVNHHGGDGDRPDLNIVS